ncbi:MAG: hypothetical protein HY770_08055 [Chitinivibrionia bacterium]|nr:hypothetical protein [Chitinivibrionia bacterium]
MPALVYRIFHQRRPRRLTLCLPAFMLLAAAVPARAQSPSPGLANGFEVDGTLFANSPLGLLEFGNDWLDGPAGPGSGMLFPSGTPKDPTLTFHILDLTGNDDQDIFSGSDKKVFGDPNLYEWKAGSVPQKDDIQNGLVQFSMDRFGDHERSHPLARTAAGLSETFS